MMKVFTAIIAVITTFAAALNVVRNSDAISINSENIRDDSGSCGTNTSWYLDRSTFTLIINGTGSIDSYYSAAGAPWYPNRSYIYSIVIEEGVTSIGFYAFCDMSNLHNITIPSTVTSITSGAISWTSELKWIYVNESNANYASIDGVLFNKAKTLLVSYPCQRNNTFKIPDGVISIGGYSFSGCKNLTYVNIPPTVTTIGEFSFSRCSNLAYVNIPSTVKTISSGAFQSCSKLENVTIPYGVTYLKAITFSYCSSLKSISIPESVKIIENQVFLSCSSLESVIIPSTVSSIGPVAFARCSSLSSLTYLGSVPPQYSSSPFASCDALKRVCVPVDYNSSSFCGIDVYSNLTKFDHLRNNQCYEILVCGEDDDDVTIKKRDSAIAWENQTNGCVVYECDNARGNVLWNKCNNSDGIDRTCMNDECVAYNTLIDKGWIVEIELKDVNITELNTTEVIERLSSLTGIDLNGVEIGIDFNDKGHITSIIVAINNGDDAKTIADAVNKIEEDECKGKEDDILCMSKKAKVISKGSVSGTPQLSLTITNMIIPLIIFIISRWV